MSDEQDDKNQLGTFLKVEKNPDGYIEWDRAGKANSYVPLVGERNVILEKLNVRKTFDIQTGTRRLSISGITRQKVRAIGVSGEYQIFFVTIAAGLQPGAATIQKTYTLGGHSLRSMLLIQATEETIIALAEAIQQAKTRRIFSVQIKEGFLWGSNPDAHSDVLLLPWLEEQKKSKNADTITFEFSFSLTEISVGPKFGGFPWGETEEAETVSASIASPVGIYHSRQEHPLLPAMSTLASEIAAFRKALIRVVWVGLFVLAFIVFRLFK